MQEESDEAPGVDAFRLSNPPPMEVACVMESLKIFDEGEYIRLYLRLRYLHWLLYKIIQCIILYNVTQ